MCLVGTEEERKRANVGHDKMIQKLAVSIRLENRCIKEMRVIIGSHDQK